MVTTESQRGNALHRTLKILRALMRGDQHDRYTAAALSGLSHAQAYRQLELMKGLPGFSSKIDGSRRIYFCEAASLLKRPTQVATVAACFGASLSGLLEGTAYRTAMHEALRSARSSSLRSEQPSRTCPSEARSPSRAPAARARIRSRSCRALRS